MFDPDDDDPQAHEDQTTNPSQHGELRGANQSGENNFNIVADRGSHIEGVSINIHGRSEHLPVEKRTVATVPLGKTGLGVLGTLSALGSVVSAVAAVWTIYAGTQAGQVNTAGVLTTIVALGVLAVLAIIAFAGWNMIRHRTLHFWRWSALPVLVGEEDRLVFQKWKVSCPTCGRRVRIRNEATQWNEYPYADGRKTREVTERQYIARCPIRGHEFRVSADASAL